MNNQALSEIFGGSIRFRLLRALYSSPDKSFGSSELAKLIGADRGQVYRLLKRWAELGVVKTAVAHSVARYSASPDPALSPLVVLFLQDNELAKAIFNRLSELSPEEVQAAAIFGSTARGETHADSDIDLILLTSKDRFECQAFFKPLSRKLGRPINVLTYAQDEWANMIHHGNPLALEIINGGLIPIKGEIHGYLEKT